MAVTGSTESPPRRSGWIPWAFAGAFALVVGANIILAVEASRSWTGVVTETPFDTGNDYNRILAETAREAAMGWKVGAEAKAVDDGKTRIAVTIEAAPSASSNAIDATLLRPIGMHAPVPLKLVQVAPGRFEADIKLPEAGNWDLRLSIGAAGAQFHTTRRLFVP